MTTHTGGKWSVHSQSDTSRYITIRSSIGRVVARVPFNSERDLRNNVPCTDAHDAALIACAPELLETLAWMLATMGEKANDKRAKKLDAARTLITKATTI